MHYWMARSFGIAAALLIVAAAFAYAFDLVFVPPAVDAAAWQAPHWRAYAWAWQWAEQLGKAGLSEGIFPSTIRQFDRSGLPAYLPWITLGVAAAALAVVSMLVMMFMGGRTGRQNVDSQREPLLNGREDGLDEGVSAAAPLPVAPTSIRTAPSLIREGAPTEGPGTAISAISPAAGGDRGHAAVLPRVPTPSEDLGTKPAMASTEFARRLESSLYDAEQALGAAMTSLEDVRRASLNLVLDPSVAQANQDLQEIHDALDELEIAFEQLRGQQHALMADLVQLDGQPAAR
jgi:hypothetical protein